jgi:hypothetical protein
MIYGLIAAIAGLLSLPVVVSLALQWLTGTQEFSIAAVAAIFFALITPVIIISIRHQTRLSRIRLIELLDEQFKLKQKANVSFEFARGKYFVDVAAGNRKPSELSETDLPRHPFQIASDWMLLLCAVPFMIFACFGFFVLFAPVDQLLSKVPGVASGSLAGWLRPSALTIGGLPAGGARDHVNALVISAVAFTGAYFYCLRLFLRAIAVFDLSAVVFLRAFNHLTITTVLALVLWRVTPDADSLWRLSSAVPAQPEVTQAQPVGKVAAASGGLSAVASAHAGAPPGSESIFEGMAADRLRARFRAGCGPAMRAAEGARRHETSAPDMRAACPGHSPHHPGWHRRLHLVPARGSQYFRRAESCGDESDHAVY